MEDNHNLARTHHMKLFALSLVATFAFSSIAFAEEAAKPTADTAVNAMTAKDKKATKKKGETCESCGKKKGECNCKHDHAEGEAGHEGHAH